MQPLNPKPFYGLETPCSQNHSNENLQVFKVASLAELEKSTHMTLP
jgi:hypothetical protein